MNEEQSTKKLVIFVHGLGGKSEKTWGRFPLLIKNDPELSREFDIIFFSYPTRIFSVPIILPRLPTISEIVDGLRTFIRHKGDKYEEIIIVGHSLGGLVIQKFLLDELVKSQIGKIRKVLLYATPNHGSRLALLKPLLIFTNNQIRQLTRNSDFIVELQRGVEVQKLKTLIDIKYVIASNDMIVSPNNARNGYWDDNAETVFQKGHLNLVKPIDHNDMSFLILKKFLLKDSSINYTQVYGNTAAQFFTKPGAQQSAPFRQDAADWLISHFKPKSISDLFQKKSSKQTNAIARMEHLKRHVRNKKTGIRMGIEELLSKILYSISITGPPGLGKTFALWNHARSHTNGSVQPLFIRIGDFDSANDFGEFLDKNVIPQENSILGSRNYCIILDGWSEFPRNRELFQEIEQRKVLATFKNIPLIVSGRTPSITGDFEEWEILPYSPEEVEQVRAILETKTDPSVERRLTGLLGFPLFLAIFVCAQHQESAKSFAIEFLHEYFAKQAKFSEKNTKSLAQGAFEIALHEEEMVWKSLIQYFHHNSPEITAIGAKALLLSLGSLGNDIQYILPIHDLYWEWLIGFGAFCKWEILSREILSNKAIRENLLLYLDGQSAIGGTVIEQSKSLSIVFASQAFMLSQLNHKRNERMEQDLKDLIFKLIEKSTATDLIRATSCMQFLHDEKLLTKLLETLETLEKSELPSATQFYPLIEKIPIASYRHLLSSWVQKYPKSSRYFLEHLKKFRDPEWATWAEDASKSGVLQDAEALRIYFANALQLNSWAAEKLDQHLAAKSLETYWFAYRLTQNSSKSLADWIFTNYDILLSPQGSNPHDINDILVRDGSDNQFDQFITEFFTKPPNVQAGISWLFSKLNDARLLKLQRTVFNGRFQESSHYKLLERFSEAATDADIESWIASDNEKINNYGWNFYAQRMQGAAIPRLIEHLPSSFSGIHFIPQLKAMRRIENLPDKAVEAIWARFNGVMQPMAMQDFINAMVQSRLNGSLALFKLAINNPLLIPTYHLGMVLSAYAEWSKSTSVKLMTKSIYGELEFPDFVAYVNFRNMINNATALTGSSSYFISHLNRENVSLLVYDDAKREKNVRSIIPRIGGFVRAGDQEIKNFVDWSASKSVVTITQWFGRAIPSMTEKCFLDLLGLVDDPENIESLIFLKLRSHPESLERYADYLVQQLISNEAPATAKMLKEIAHIPRKHIRNSFRKYIEERNPTVIRFIRAFEIVHSEIILSEDLSPIS